MNKTNRMTAAEFQKYISQNNSGGNDIGQSYCNRISNDRGRSFENLLMKGCQYYHNRGVAVINKVYEPYIVTKQLPDGRFAGRHCGQAEPDFKGVLSGGRAIAFEAKSTHKTRIQYGAVTPTQLRWLQEQRKLGALTFVAVNIKEHFYSIPLYRWEKMKELYGKKFLMHGDIEQYEVKFDGAVRFLEYEGGGWLPNEEA